MKSARPCVYVQENAVFFTHALVSCSTAKQLVTGGSSVRVPQPSLGRQDSDERLVGARTPGTTPPRFLDVIIFVASSLQRHEI